MAKTKVKVNEFKVIPQDFQDAFIASDAAFPAMVAAWGTGKTMCAIIKVVTACLAYPNNLALVGRKNFTDLKDSTIKDFEIMTGIKVDSYGDVRFQNGSRIMFRHAEQFEKLNNINLGVCFLEQAEEFDTADQFDLLCGRMRRKNCGTPQLFIIANTNGNNWIKERWKTNPIKEIPIVEIVDGKPVETGKYRKGYELFEAKSWDNASNLIPSFIDKIYTTKKTQPRVYEQMVENSWEITSGKIFEMWNEDYHVIPQINLPDHWECFGSMDTAVASGVFCAKIYKVSETGNIIACAEYYDKGKLISEHAKGIKEMMEKGGFQPAYWIFDPAAFNKTRENPKLGKLYSVADELADREIFGLPGENDVNAGINRLGEYLSIDYSRQHPFKSGLKGSPRFFQMSNCVNSIREISQYREVSNKLTNRGEMKWAPYKHNDHSCDTDRYAIMSRPQAAKWTDNPIIPRHSVFRIMMSELNDNEDED